MDRNLAAGGSRWRLVTENIGHCATCRSPPSQGDIERQHEDWMKSPEHRANILSQGLDSFGLGLATADGDLYAVQNFAGPGRPLALAEDETAEPLESDALAAVAADERPVMACQD